MCCSRFDSFGAEIEETIVEGCNYSFITFCFLSFGVENLRHVGTLLLQNTLFCTFRFVNLSLVFRVEKKLPLQLRGGVCTMCESRGVQ